MSMSIVDLYTHKRKASNALTTARLSVQRNYA